MVKGTNVLGGKVWSNLVTLPFMLRETNVHGGGEAFQTVTPG